ncbi:unnamed protein product (macronuclear) [Paramecium tetraurelia]|uniref:Uncharacterized protein n=1 Tax=Paramecium tetraurelia TaxID=5888 RepID=A0CT65_PARTE|nr:uncharacterized protein GSPATT00010216001 [Paramecium tetraurelia]CAK73982.1 unnamed protein product [Paramecium tetraurelia]|eukprot:XP_001441379.1 hypothetical protein (macronuclear) [Paramecium tetraurelia strain d4-2]
MHQNQIEIFIDQRIANEVEMLKRKKDNQNKPKPKDDKNDDDDDYYGHIQYTDIEHIKEFKQVRVGFEGKQLSLWSSAIYYFVIKYFNYPLEPVRIEFPREFRHQYIIPNTGVYCHPEWSQKYWQRSVTLEHIINRVIQTFHEIPTYSDYPADLSFIQLSLDKAEYQNVINANKDCSTHYNNKIQEERQYFERKRQLEHQNASNKKKNEDQQQQDQKKQEQEQNNQAIKRQEEDYHNGLKLNQQQNQDYNQQLKLNDQIHELQNNKINYNQSVPQQIHQQQLNQQQISSSNPNQQQHNFNHQAQNNQQIPQFQQQQIQQEQNQANQNNQKASNNPKIKIIGNVK